ncbi:peptidoglycan recognition protein family protein [Dermabacteraceae bacterium CCM 9519]
MTKIETSRRSPNTWRGRYPVKTSITIHYWGSRGQKFDNVADWLCNPRSRVSAHYVVEGGRIAQLLPLDRGAWHSGSGRGNRESIAIECRPEATDADYATVAELIRDLRKEYGPLPLVPHNSWTSTDCPGPWDLHRLDQLARSLPAGSAAGTAAPLPAGSTAGGRRQTLIVDGVLGKLTAATLQEYLNKHGAHLAVDGFIGRLTWQTLQRHLGTPADGEVSGQRNSAAYVGPAIRAGWKRGLRGSTMIRALQARTGAQIDGQAGRETVSRLQAYLNQKG